MTKNAIDVTCPTCRAVKGEACRTVIVGGSEYHASRYRKASDFGRAVIRMEAERRAALQEAAKTRARHRVEPINGSWELAVKCYSCGAKPGIECTWKRGTKQRFHKQRVGRGKEAMKRSTENDH